MSRPSPTPPGDEPGRRPTSRPGIGHRRGRLGLLAATTAMVAMTAATNACGKDAE